MAARSVGLSRWHRFRVHRVTVRPAAPLMAGRPRGAATVRRESREPPQAAPIPNDPISL
jgi:hypothetical protein